MTECILIDLQKILLCTYVMYVFANGTVLHMCPCQTTSFNCLPSPTVSKLIVLLVGLLYWCPSPTPTIITINQSRQDDSSSGSSSSKNELPGIPRVQINKYTGRPFSQRFWQILEKRKTLPVWEYYNRFMEMLQKHKCVVLVGETGSGKTTQVGVLASKLCLVWCTL